MLEALAIFVAGVWAGTINAVVGSGTLVTFPVLLAFGYPPVIANVSSSVGLVPGSLSGAIGYRRELRGQRSRAIRLGTASVLGGITGAVALLVLPPAVFQAVVPVIVALAVVAIVVQPRVAAALERRGRRTVGSGSALMWVAIYATGVYGGYFGAAQGILLLAILGITLDESLQRVNALKNVLAVLVNGVAALIFIVVADVAWGPALLIAAGAVLGGQLGSRYGRRLPANALRAIIVVVGVAALVQLLR